MEKSNRLGPEDVPKLIPARMLNEFAYCPRLCYIEWVHGEFRDSADTVEGRYVHRKVDDERGRIPDEWQELHTRSITLSAHGLGVSTKIDMIEGSEGKVTPIEYKRGSPPDIPEGAYEPERVQLCAQGLVLRENGFNCDEGFIYFASSKKKVRVPFDEGLILRTRQLIKEMRSVMARGEIPPPLIDSPKCPRCSLVGICMPDEVNMLRGASESMRMLYPSRDDTIPVYVVDWGCSIHKNGDRLQIRKEKEPLQEIPFRQVSQLSIYGDAYISPSVLRELMQRGCPVCYFSHGGWFYGISEGVTSKNIELRMAQYAAAMSECESLKIVRPLVVGKIKNCRTMLRRNDPDIPHGTLRQMAKLARDASRAPSTKSLLGIEGAAAHIYFSRFNKMLHHTDVGFSFEERNKHPPRDPVNATLSYLYGILVKECFVTLLAVGFDPYLGFYHRPKYGKPALALDLMEEFRPIIADSVAITMLNNRELQRDSFVITKVGVSLKKGAKKKVVCGYERRINTEVTHPIFGYKVSYRRVLEVQARLLGRVLTGEIREYPPFCTR